MITVKTIKRTLAVLLAASLCMTAVPAVYADENIDIETLEQQESIEETDVETLDRQDGENSTDIRDTLAGITHDLADAAENAILGALEEDGIENISIQDLYEKGPKNYYFSSGAGGWETEIFLDEDWGFSGYYHDSEMGDSTEEYPYGTLYVCSFTGKFADFEQISPYAVSMKLESLSQEGQEGDEEIANEMRYVTSYPYGISGGEDFILYLPGTPLDDLSEDCLMWTMLFLNREEKEVLPEGFYILFNCQEETAFVGMTDDYVME